MTHQANSYLYSIIVIKGCQPIRMNRFSIKIALLFFIAIHTFQASAQYNPFQSIKEFDDKSTIPGSVDSLSVPFVFLEVHDTLVLTHALGKAFPNLRIPYDSIHIAFPDLSQYQDTLGMLWLLKSANRPGPGILSLMLIGMKADSSLHYFIDTDNNGDYADAGNPVTLGPEIAVEQFFVKDAVHGQFEFLFNNPAYAPQGRNDQAFNVDNEAQRAEALKRSRTNDSIWIVSSDKPSVIIRTGLLVGPGKARMEFNTLVDEQIKHRKFVADIFSSGAILTEAGVRYKAISVGISLTAEMLMYSDYLEYFTSINPNAGELMTNYTSHGSWPPSRFSYGVFAGYSLRLSRDIRLSAFGTLSRYTIPSQHYFIRSIPRSIGSTFNDTWLHSTGLRLKFISGRREALYFSAAWQASYFDATPYFTDIDPDSFTMSFHQFVFGFGLEFRGGKK